MSIVAMQSMLLFMFWLNIVSMEEQLVPLNKVIENSPQQAKASVCQTQFVECWVGLRASGISSSQKIVPAPPGLLQAAADCRVLCRAVLWGLNPAGAHLSL
jgi:hypothetical protein